MHKVGLIIAYLLAISAGLLGALIWVVMLLASMPNSNPQQLSFLRNLAIGSGVGSLVLTAVGVWLVYCNHPVWGVLVACIPGVAFFVMAIYVSVR